MMKACRSCNWPVPPGVKYCQKPECQANVRDVNAHWSSWRDRGTQAAFRERLLTEFEGRCAMIENGVRCPATLELQAHHGRDGGPDLLLCRPHHRAVDPHAR